MVITKPCNTDGTSKTVAPDRGRKPTKTMAASQLIDLAEAKAIAAGTHNDPFSILGGHKKKAGYVVCAFDPGAEKMAALTGKKTVTELMPVPDAHGVFVGRLARKAVYRLRGTAGDGSWTQEDAFRFGPVLGDLDRHLISEGTHHRLWQALGAHVICHEKTDGTHFAVWAPNARRVSLVGDFNYWDGRHHPMRALGSSGVWEIFLPNIGEGAVYKYQIIDAQGNELPLKADPVGFGAEHPRQTGSVVRDLSGYKWTDAEWMNRRGDAQNISSAISIYEVHLGSWRRVQEDGGRRFSYLEAAQQLVDYALDMGFTHIELMPISEYPFDGSWGYQPVGMYAPTIRFGLPEEFRALVDTAHKRGLGVLIDWVPGHFPTDDHGLGCFNGTALYEHADPREGFHRDWKTLIYNYGRSEVANYLIANALYWLREHHVDGLRVDAVASMLYRDYSRDEGEWVPNRHGGRENLEAIDFLKRMNEAVYSECPGIMTAAEESTSFPGVSRPTDHDGLGFGFKWNMGWMNDTLEYIKHDPIHRKYHHHQMTFGIQYAFSENFILPISHDEVVHGKGSMLIKMPGNEWERFANLRAYYGFMWSHPGKKLLFMGCEFAQASEWNHDVSLDWHLLDYDLHRGIQSFVRDLNGLYRETAALHVKDCDPSGFHWLDLNSEAESVFAFARFGHADDPPVVTICNFAPVERENWRIGFPRAGQWQQVINSDSPIYGGGGRGQAEMISTEDQHWHECPQSVTLTLPPLSTLMYRFEQQ